MTATQHPNWEQIHSQTLEPYLNAQLDTMVQQLMQLIRYPSISQKPDHWHQMEPLLNAVSAIMQPMGFETEILHSPGCPSLLATLRTSPERPWVLIYNHMDVQPAEEPQWTTTPFEPELRDGRVYGRGSTDDKGPALSTLHAIHCLQQAGLPLPNIQVIYETEEESGSKHFGQILDTYRDRFESPASILVSDTIFEGEHPAITYRLKGLLRAEVSLTTGTQDLHSGMVGGAAINPLNVLVQALSQCVDAQGNVTIPGVMAELPPVSEAERASLQRTAAIFDLAKLKADTGQAELYSDQAQELLERIWLRPTFEVHGFEGVQTEPGVIKTALPYAVKAKVTMRLVAGQDPERVLQQLTDCLQAVHPGIAVRMLGASRGCFSAVDNRFMQAAVVACEAGFGREPVFVGSGGTIGALPEFERVFVGAPLVLIAQSLMSDGYHAPNENFQLQQMRNGFKTMAHYLLSLADL